MKKSSSEKFFYVIATIVGAGFYALLFSLFKFEIKAKATKDKSYRHLADVIMLPIEKNPSLPWQKNLIAALDLLDPTIMSLPNTSYGFSNVRNLEFERPIRPLAPYNIQIEFQSTLQHKPLQFTAPIDDLLHAININNRLEIGPISNDESSDPPLKPSVYWTDIDGNILDHLPPISVSDVIKGEEQRITSGPTPLQVVFSDNLVRVRLQGSCGDPQLDQIALTNLLRYFTAEQAKSTSGTQNESEVRKAIKIFAYWRFANEINETVNINMEDELYDRDWF